MMKIFINDNYDNQLIKDEKRNFPYRKLFTSRLNVFLIRKLYIYLSYLSYSKIFT